MPQQFKEFLVESVVTYKYHVTNNGKTIFYHKETYPFLIISSADGKPVRDASKFYLVSVKSRVMKKIMDKHYSDVVFKKVGSDDPEWNQLLAFLKLGKVAENLEIVKKYPEALSLKTIDGRARLFKIVTTDFSMPVTFFQNTLFSVEDDAHAGDDDVINLGDTKIFYPTDMKLTRRAEFFAVLKDIKAFFEKIGLPHVFGGDIRFAKLKSGTYGAYYPKSKDVIIDPSAKKVGLKEVLIHEYFHRHYYQFLPDNMRKAVEKKFLELKRTLKSPKPQAPEAVDVKPGQSVEYAGTGRKYKKYKWAVKSISSGRVYLTGVDAAGSQITIFATPEVFRSSGFKLGTESKTSGSRQYNSTSVVIDTNAWFPTVYSESNESEWYAECMALLSRGHLKGEVADYFRQFMRYTRRIS